MPPKAEPLLALHEAYRSIQEAKPGDRSRRDRAYAVTLTNLELVIGYFKTWAMNDELEIIVTEKPKK